VTPEILHLNVNDDGKVITAEFRTLPKIGLYVISHANEICRIGECSSGAQRLKKGFQEQLRHMRRGKERKNYIAYSWRGNYRGCRIRVEYFELKHERFLDAHFRRALEAEVTFQVRIAKNAWPRDMSEIHFLERFRRDPLLESSARGVLAHFNIEYVTHVKIRALTAAGRFGLLGVLTMARPRLFSAFRPGTV
jgi:hypothetical protein